VASQRLGIQTNLIATASTQYVGFNFNSFCTFQGKLLGFNSDGIYECMKCNDDDGTDIDAKIKLPRTNMGLIAHKRINQLLLNLKAETGSVFYVKTYDDQQNERTYSLEPLYGSSYHHLCRLNIGRDGVGVNWTIEIGNSNGCDFSLDTIEAIITVLNKWVRDY
jgi:hypothetical protein